MESQRRHLRFSCQGSADLSDGANGRVWGALGDISLSGFYLSTFGPWPVDTEVRFKLEVEGEQICGVGTVTTSHPGVGMGVTFVEISREYQVRLNEIVRRLEESGTGEASVGLPV